MTEPSLPPPDKPEKPAKSDPRAAQRLLVVALALIVIGGGGLLAWDRMRTRNDVVVRPLPNGRPAQTPASQTPVPQAPSQAPTAQAPSAQAPTDTPTSQAPEAPVAPSVPVTPPSAPSPPASAAPEQTAPASDLAARLAEIERRLAAPPQPAPNPAADAHIAQLEARVATLENSVTAERARADRAEQTARAADDRLAQTVRAATALAHLRTNLERGQPFEREYDEAYAILGNNSAAVARLQALRQWAESGIPTRAELREALESQGSEIVRAALLEEGGTWWQAILARIKALVIVRPTPDADAPAADAEGGDRPAAIVARAETRVRDDDIAGAISEMMALTGGAADTALAWVAAARARLGADEAIGALEESLQNLADTARPSDSRPDSGVETESP